jgi:hypothetical protein
MSIFNLDQCYVYIFLSKPLNNHLIFIWKLTIMHMFIKITNWILNYHVHLLLRNNRNKVRSIDNDKLQENTWSI